MNSINQKKPISRRIDRLRRLIPFGIWQMEWSAQFQPVVRPLIKYYEGSGEDPLLVYTGGKGTSSSESERIGECSMPVKGNQSELTLAEDFPI
jgi:hypothetical protein